MSFIKKPILLDSLVLSALSAFLLGRTWQKWAHPVWDLGREVYIPWRITQGEVLYKDLAYMFGAFPPLWNAFLFHVFGPSLLTIAISNIIIALIFTGLIYRFFYKTADRLTAFISAVVFLCLFAFSLYNSHNSYYISPYSHSCLFALFFGLCSLNFIYNFLHTLKPGHLLGSGICLGLMLLSRLEIFIAFLLPAVAVLRVFISRHDSKSLERSTSWNALLLGVAVPFVICLCYFALQLPFLEAVTSIIGYQPKWFEISQLPLYKTLGGYSTWQNNLRSIITSVSLYLVIFLGLKLTAWVFKSTHLKATQSSTAVFVLLLNVVMCYALQKFGIQYLLEIFVGQMLLLISLAVYCIGQIRNTPGNDKMRANAFAVLILCFWGALLLLKIPMRSAPMGYGYFYALPGVLATTFFVLSVVPKYFGSNDQMYRFVKIILASILLFICTVNQLQSLNFLKLKLYPVGQGNNRTWTIESPRLFKIGSDVEQFLVWARQNIRPEETFVTFPQGVMLNFLSGHRISGPHVTFMPVEITAYGEKAMLNSLILDPPDYFLYINHTMTVYGNIIPGQNYGTSILDWVNTHYSPVWMTGTEFGSPGFGIKVLKRIRN